MRYKVKRKWGGCCNSCAHLGLEGICEQCNEWDRANDEPERYLSKLWHKIEWEKADKTQFEQILDNMASIHKAKNNDYSPRGQFGNFAESEKVGVPDWKGAFIRLQDKYIRCCNLIGGREAQVLDEKLEDTLLDLANYAVIVMCLLKAKE